MSLLCVRQGTRHFSHATLNPESNTTMLSYPNCAGKVSEDLRVSGTCLGLIKWVIQNLNWSEASIALQLSGGCLGPGNRMLVINGWNQSS